MVLDERSRHELYLKLEQVLGPEPARILMEHLPPVGWADVATKRDLDQHAAITKRDLDQLAERIDLRCDALEHKMTAALKSEIAAQTRTVVFAVLGSVLGSTSLALFAARIAT